MPANAKSDRFYAGHLFAGFLCICSALGIPRKSRAQSRKDPQTTILNIFIFIKNENIYRNLKANRSREVYLKKDLADFLLSWISSTILKLKNFTVSTFNECLEELLTLSKTCRYRGRKTEEGIKKISRKPKGSSFSLLTAKLFKQRPF